MEFEKASREEEETALRTHNFFFFYNVSNAAQHFSFTRLSTMLMDAEHFPFLLIEVRIDLSSDKTHPLQYRFRPLSHLSQSAI